MMGVCMYVLTMSLSVLFVMRAGAGSLSHAALFMFPFLVLVLLQSETKEEPISIT